jgi:DNA-binding transcriptional ArsR family regulator
MPKSYGLPPAKAASFFHALGHKTRVRVLLVLAERGEVNVLSLQAAAGLSQPNASHHLRLLRVAGVVDTRRDGHHVLYRLASPAVAAVLRLMCGA